MDLEEELVLVDVRAQVPFLLGGNDGAAHRGQPGLHRPDQRVAHGAGAVVEFDGAADVDAARVDLDGGALHPVAEQRAQARQPTCLVHRGEENLVLEARVVFADDGDLQFLARAEVREHARLAHLRHFSERADGQPFEADLRGQAQRGVHDRGLGLLALVQRPPFARAAGRLDGQFSDGHGVFTRNKTNGRSILHETAPGQAKAGTSREPFLGAPRANPGVRQCRGVAAASRTRTFGSGIRRHAAWRTSMLSPTR